MQIIFIRSLNLREDDSGRREGECIPARMKMLIISVWLFALSFCGFLILRQRAVLLMYVYLLCPAAQQCAERCM